jgi:hypothetical protein
MRIYLVLDIVRCGRHAQEEGPVGWGSPSAGANRFKFTGLAGHLSGRLVAVRTPEQP